MTRRGLGFAAGCTSHPDRNAQFEHINAQVTAFQAAGEPAISVDTKKKELVGDFKNGGRALRPKRRPELVRVHDFVIPELGKAVPYGVYDIAANVGWVNLGISHDTAAFAVESIRRWWHELGSARYPAATRLLITANCGGSKGGAGAAVEARTASPCRRTRDRHHGQPSAARHQQVEPHRAPPVRLHYSAQNWRGKPLLSHQVIVQLIANTRTKTGLTVACRIDASSYDKDIKVSDAEMAALNIQPNKFRGEWNYTFATRRPDT